jgi:hypothetical protein
MTIRRVFVDTGAWYAVQVKDDEWHDDAVGAFQGAARRAPHPRNDEPRCGGDVYAAADDLRARSGRSFPGRGRGDQASRQDLRQRRHGGAGVSHFSVSTPIRTSASSMRRALPSCVLVAFVTPLPSTSISRRRGSCGSHLTLRSHSFESSRLRPEPFRDRGTYRAFGAFDGQGQFLQFRAMSLSTTLARRGASGRLRLRYQR